MTKSELTELANKINSLENRSQYGHWSNLKRDKFGDYDYDFILMNGNRDNHIKTIYSFSDYEEVEELFQMVQQVFEGKATFKDFVAKFV